VIAPLDSFRGFAALWVVVYHTYVWLRPYFESLGNRVEWFVKGRKGVAVFFVLSGFLLYRSARKIKSLDDIHHYLVRRFLRIYPLFFVTAVASFVFGYCKLESTSIQNILAELLMFPVLGPLPISNPPSHTIFFEVLFYFLLPIWVIATRSAPFKWALVALMTCILLGDALTGHGGAIFFKYVFVGIVMCELTETRFFKTITQWQAAGVFGLGCFLFFIDTWSIVTGLEQFLVGIVRDFPPWLGMNHYLHFDPSPYSAIIPESTLVGLSIGLILLGVMYWKPASRFFSLYPLRFIGHISYSIFLWQAFIILAQSGKTFDQATIGGELLLLGKAGRAPFILLYLPALFFWSSLSYYFIELPFLRMRKR
jgi:peptidoglycan/LPS O-acetylase OafA/YrhL